MADGRTTVQVSNFLLNHFIPNPDDRKNAIINTKEDGDICVTVRKEWDFMDSTHCLSEVAGRTQMKKVVSEHLSASSNGTHDVFFNDKLDENVVTELLRRLTTYTEKIQRLYGMRFKSDFNIRTFVFDADTTSFSCGQPAQACADKRELYLLSHNGILDINNRLLAHELSHAIYFHLTKKTHSLYLRPEMGERYSPWMEGLAEYTSYRLMTSSLETAEKVEEADLKLGQEILVPLPPNQNDICSIQSSEKKPNADVLVLDCSQLSHKIFVGRDENVFKVVRLLSGASLLIHAKPSEGNLTHVAIYLYSDDAIEIKPPICGKTTYNQEEISVITPCGPIQVNQYDISSYGDRLYTTWYCFWEHVREKYGHEKVVSIVRNLVSRNFSDKNIFSAIENEIGMKENEVKAFLYNIQAPNNGDYVVDEEIIGP